jgi:hypothetical protein
VFRVPLDSTPIVAKFAVGFTGDQGVTKTIAEALIVILSALIYDEVIV